MRRPNAHLTEKQRRFREAYARTGNGYQAALEAGYEKSVAKWIGSVNLRKPFMRDLMVKLQDREEAERESAILSLERRKEVLTTIAITEPPGPPSHAERIRAIGELNKMDGVYETGVKVDNRKIEFTFVYDDDRDATDTDTPKELSEA